MPARDWKLRIEDILEAIQEIIQYTDGMTFEAFCKDTKTVKAVLYCIAVIGEAVRHIPHDVRMKYSEIPWREIGDMRNVVIHEYFGIDTDILWKTVCYDLPLLESSLKRITDESGMMQLRLR